MRARRLLPLVPVLGFIATGGLPCHWQTGAVLAASARAMSPAPPRAGQEIHLHLSEWSLSPAQFQVQPGVPVRLLATNDGALAHALAVEGDNLYAETPAIASRETGQLDLVFDTPGIYDLFCPLAAGQHRALGQDGKIAAGPDAAALLDLAPDALAWDDAPLEPDGEANS